VVDIGGGTSDAAVITMGSVCLARSVRVAGNTFSEAIIRYIRRERDVYIGELTAERIKKTVGCAYLRPEEIEMVAKGKNSITGMPVSFDVNSTEIYLAIREQINQIIKIIVDVLEQTPPELAADVIQEGIILTGGGAKLTGLPSAVEEATGIKTRLATDSANCVANGIGQVLKNMEFLDNMGYLFKSREEITGIEEN
jgi:rod shape-determining protein MreB